MRPATSQSAPIYASKAATGGFKREPNCGASASLPRLPTGKIVHYTGATLFGFARNGCAREDYAQVVLQASCASWLSVLCAGGSPSFDMAFNVAWQAACFCKLLC